MIHESAPVTNAFVSVPADMGQLNCAAFLAGIIAGVLDSARFVSHITALPFPANSIYEEVFDIVLFLLNIFYYGHHCRPWSLHMQPYPPSPPRTVLYWYSTHASQLTLSPPRMSHRVDLLTIKLFSLSSSQRKWWPGRGEWDSAPSIGSVADV